MKKKEVDSIYQIVNELRINGIHSIIVDTPQEAKNFIMHHIGMETLIYIDDSYEIKSLNIEKSAIYRGGTLHTINELGNTRKEKGQRSIGEIILLGYRNFYEMIKGEKKLQVPIDDVKIILIVQEKINENSFLKIYNEVINKDNFQLQQILKVNKNDISIIFIREKY